MQEHEHVPVVKQEPDNVEEDNFEPLDAEFGSSTFDPLDDLEDFLEMNKNLDDFLAHDIFEDNHVWNI